MNALSLSAHNAMTWDSYEIFAAYANDSHAQISSKFLTIKWKMLCIRLKAYIFHH
jgi:hypothetical protein